MSDLLEHWPSDPALEPFQSHLLERSRANSRADVIVDDVFDEHVYAENGCRDVKLLAAREVGPHVDSWFPQWSVLLVLQRSIGQVLHVADHQPRDPGKRYRKPAKKITETLPLDEGQLILFSAHHTHWLSPGRDNTLFIGLSLDFNTRPSQQQVRLEIATIAKNFSIDLSSV